jgi:hypothetical protein
MITDQHTDWGVSMDGGVVGHFAEGRGDPLRLLQIKAGVLDRLTEADQKL